MKQSKRLLAAILVFAMIVSTASGMFMVSGTGDISDENLLSGLSMNYYLKAKWSEKVGSSDLATDGAFRGDGTNEWNGNSAVTGVTFDTASINGGSSAINFFTFVLTEASDIAVLNIDGYRENGNRTYGTLEVFVSDSAIAVDASNYTTVTEGLTKVEYTMDKVVIDGAPKASEADQYFNLTLNLTGATNVKGLLIKTNANQEGKFTQFDEIRAYAPAAADDDSSAESSEEVPEEPVVENVIVTTPAEEDSNVTYTVEYPAQVNEGETFTITYTFAGYDFTATGVNSWCFQHDIDTSMVVLSGKEKTDDYMSVTEADIYAIRDIETIWTDSANIGGPSKKACIPTTESQIVNYLIGAAQSEAGHDAGVYTSLVVDVNYLAVSEGTATYTTTNVEFADNSFEYYFTFIPEVFSIEIVGEGSVESSEEESDAVVESSEEVSNVVVESSEEVSEDSSSEDAGPVEGSAEWPYSVYGDTQLTAPANTTIYYTVYYKNGMNMTVSVGGSVVEETVVNGMWVTCVYPNTTAEDVVVDIKFTSPLGSMDNPAELVMGDNSADIPADSQGYFYTWTADEAGTLTITMPAGDWTYAINNLTAGTYGDTQWSDSDPVVPVATVEVAAGDEIQIMVNNYDPADMWSTPAGVLVINAAFEADSEDVSEDISEDVSEDISEDISEDVSEDSSSEDVGPVEGSAEWPYSVYGDTQLIAPANTTIYYTVYYKNGMTMEVTANGEGTTTTVAGMFANYTYENNTAEDVVVDIKFVVPLGSMGNPAELVMGDNSADIEANAQGYFYTWTADEAGTLTITMPAGQWSYTINNITAGTYGDTQWSDSDPVVPVATVEVAAGDEIQVIVNTYDAADMWNTPAGTIVINAAFEAEAQAPAVDIPLVDVAGDAQYKGDGTDNGTSGNYCETPGIDWETYHAGKLNDDNIPEGDADATKGQNVEVYRNDTAPGEINVVFKLAEVTDVKLVNIYMNNRTSNANTGYPAKIEVYVGDSEDYATATYLGEATTTDPEGAVRLYSVAAEATGSYVLIRFTTSEKWRITISEVEIMTEAEPENIAGYGDYKGTGNSNGTGNYGEESWNEYHDGKLNDGTIATEATNTVTGINVEVAYNAGFSAGTIYVYNKFESTALVNEVTVYMNQRTTQGNRQHPQTINVYVGDSEDISTATLLGEATTTDTGYVRAYTVSGEYLAGTYVIVEAVMATGTAYIAFNEIQIMGYCDKPAAPEVPALDAPANITGNLDRMETFEAPTISWDAVEGAVAYDVYVGDTLVGENLTETTYTIVMDPVVAYGSNTSYSQATVVAKGDGVNFADSAKSESYNFFYVEKPLDLRGNRVTSADIIIDPGHGGSQPGACLGERQEKDDTLAMSLRVGELFEALGYTVAFTRIEDVDDGLMSRAAKVNAGDFDLFICIHRNSFTTEGVSGLEVLYQTGDTTDEAFAQAVLDQYKALNLFVDRGLKPRDNLVVTNNTKAEVPTILVELGFISNIPIFDDQLSDNEKFDTYFDDIALATVKGSMDYLGYKTGYNGTLNVNGTEYTIDNAEVTVDVTVNAGEAIEIELELINGLGAGTTLYEEIAGLTADENVVADDSADNFSAEKLVATYTIDTTDLNGQYQFSLDQVLDLDAELLLIGQFDIFTINYVVEVEEDDSSVETSDDASSDIESSEETSDDVSSDVDSSEDVSDDVSSDVDTSDDTSDDDTSGDVEADILYGDVNNDGYVDSLDAAQVLKYDALLIDLDADALVRGDVNGDGYVDSLDAAQILKFDALLIDSFPVEEDADIDTSVEVSMDALLNDEDDE